MKTLSPGQHFGAGKRKLHLDGTILTEAGFAPGIEVPWHYHENAYFFLHLRGHLQEINKKKSIECTPGTLLFHHWQDPHYDTKFSRNALFFHLEIENKWFIKFNLKQTILEGSFHLESLLLKSIFRNIHNELNLNDNATQLSIDGLLAQAFGILARQSEYEKNETPLWTKKVREILLEVDPENITLDLLSNETGIHPVYLSHQFPKYFGAGFGEYIRKMKLEKATRLLADPSISITDISYQCGFSDQSHFIRQFKLTNGITPLKYRKSLLK